MPTNSEWIDTLREAKAAAAGDKERSAKLDAELKHYSSLVAAETKTEKAVAPEASEKR